MYASTIQARPPSEKCREFLIAGMATLTTVTSMVSSSAARQSTARASTCRLVQAKAAVAPASAVCTVESVIPHLLIDQ